MYFKFRKCGFICEYNQDFFKVGKNLFFLASLIGNLGILNLDIRKYGFI